MSAAESVFQQFTEGGWEYLLRIEEERRPESLHLEFKTTQGEDGELERSDRKNLAKSLSGFANADGGVVVWGVDARKDKKSDEYNHAVALKALDNPTDLIARINELLPEMVEPTVPGVQNRAVTEKNGGHGVVVTLIPKSVLAPHQAAGAGHAYYRRAGSSFLPMHDYEVRDMLGRRPQPALAVSTKLTFTRHQRRNGPLVLRVVVDVTLVNEGRGMAKWPCITFREPTAGDRPRLVDEGLLPWIGAPVWAWCRAAGGSETALYPEDELRICKMQWEHLVQAPPPNDGYVVPYEAVAEGAEPISGDITVTRQEVRTGVRREFGI